jgi:hypothetical protein
MSSWILDNELHERINTMNLELSEWRAFGSRFRTTVMGHEHASTRHAGDCEPDILKEVMNRLEATLDDYKKLCAAVRTAAMGPGHSMGDRFAELAVIVKQRDEAQKRVVELETMTMSGNVPGKPDLVKKLRAEIRMSDTPISFFECKEVSKVLDALDVFQGLLRESRASLDESRAAVKTLREQDARLREGWRVQVERKDLQLAEAREKLRMIGEGDHEGRVAQALREEELVEARVKIMQLEKELSGVLERSNEIYKELARKSRPLAPDDECLVIARVQAGSRVELTIGEVGIFRIATHVLETWINDDYFGKEPSWLNSLPASAPARIDPATWPLGTGVIIRSAAIVVPKPTTKWQLEAAP